MVSFATTGMKKMPKEWWEDEYYSDDVFLYPGDKRHNRLTSQKIRLELDVPPNNYTRTYSEEEKQMLRPIAETLAMLHGNAFFTQQLTNEREWYEQYLPEAMALFESNGGVSGRAGAVSWIKDLEHPSAAVKEAYDSWRALRSLSYAKNA
jgi:hypothetical protein